MDFKHEINDLKVGGDKNHVDENVSKYGILNDDKKVKCFFCTIEGKS